MDYTNNYNGCCNCYQMYDRKGNLTGEPVPTGIQISHGVCNPCKDQLIEQFRETRGQRAVLHAQLRQSHTASRLPEMTKREKFLAEFDAARKRLEETSKKGSGGFGF